jgi:hypothetical protein
MTTLQIVNYGLYFVTGYVLEKALNKKKLIVKNMISFIVWTLLTYWTIFGFEFIESGTHFGINQFFLYFEGRLLMAIAGGIFMLVFIKIMRLIFHSK